MACPITAAIVALLAEVRGTFDPATLENALAATANPNLFNNGASTFPYLAPVAQQGAGLVQAYDAAYATTLVSVSSIAFNDTANFVPFANFTLTNTGSETVYYHLSNVGAATGYTFTPNDIVYPDVFPNVLTPIYATIDFVHGKRVRIPAGGSANVAFTLSPPDLPSTRLPVYGGYIAMNGSDGSTLSLPYQGVIGSMYEQTVLDAANTYLTRSNSAAYTPVAANTTFTLPIGNSSANQTTIYPELVASMPFGSAQVRADLSPTGLSPYGSNVTTVFGVPTLGNIFGFPEIYVPRGLLVADFDGMLENGALVPAGSYSIVVRALRIFGDPAVAEDWMLARTVPFTI